MGKDGNLAEFLGYLERIETLQTKIREQRATLDVVETIITNCENFASELDTFCSVSGCVMLERCKETFAYLQNVANPNKVIS